jgi:hypothetical protein
MNAVAIERAARYIAARVAAAARAKAYLTAVQHFVEVGGRMVHGDTFEWKHDLEIKTVTTVDNDGKPPLEAGVWALVPESWFEEKLHHSVLIEVSPDLPPGTIILRTPCGLACDGPSTARHLSTEAPTCMDCVAWVRHVP